MGRFLRALGFGMALVGALSLVAAWQGFGGLVQGSGKVRTESRAVRDIAEVDLATAGTLVIAQGEVESLAIEAEDNVLPYLTADAREGRLDLGVRRGTYLRATKPIRYTLTVRDLRALKVSGSGDVEMAALKGERLALRVSGSGKIQLGQLTADTLAIDISGSGNIGVGGTVNRQEIDISGSGRVRAEGLASKVAKIETSGSGEATLQVSDTLEVEISGSGTVSYLGSPRVTSDVSGSGGVKPIAAR